MKKIFGGLAVVGIFLWWASSVSPGSIVIEGGDSVQSVAVKLRSEKIVRSETLVKIAYRLFGSGEHVYPGTVVIGPSCSIRCVIREITSAQPSIVRIRLTEGQDIRDLATVLESKKIGTAADLLAIVGTPAVVPTKHTDFSGEFSFLASAPKNISLEGYLFPDTYDFSGSATPEQVVRTMLKNFDRRVTPEMRERAAKQGRTLHEVVTMASILDLEVRGAEDQRMVADILWRRISRGMGLQVDSSVKYLTKSAGVFTTKQERATVSLWNTYKFRGLPLGPIGNPGISAIEAALSPKPNEYWFYLTSPDGTVHYARTLDEHVSNKRFLK